MFPYIVPSPSCLAFLFVPFPSLSEVASVEIAFMCDRCFHQLAFAAKKEGGLRACVCVVVKQWFLRMCPD